MADRRTTRQRLLAEGMRLFAERGFDATTVGDIEIAAGLKPRRGGLYKHFASKDALLHEAVQSHLDDVAAGAAGVSELDLGDPAEVDPALLRPVLLGLGRWFLDELDRERHLVSILEHDRGRLQHLAQQLHANIVDRGHRAAASLLAAVAPGAKDPEAIAVLLLGSLVALRRTAWTFGAPALDVDDNRALEQWAEITLATLQAQLANTPKAPTNLTARRERQ